MQKEEFVNFVRLHLDDDPVRMLLSAHRFPGIDVQQAVQQIVALRKIRTKIPHWHRPELAFPLPLAVEQASSERTARFKSSLLSGRQLADLTGGMGVDTSFFAGQFDTVTYVEHNPVLVDAARHNFSALGLHNIAVVPADAEQFLRATNTVFDWIYLDPARRDERRGRVFELADCQPNILAILDLLLEKARHVLLKAAPLLDIQLALRQLDAVARVWVVSVDNEVKELLFVLEGRVSGNTPAVGSAPEHVPVTAACLGPTDRAFVFTRAEEQAAAPSYALPLRYLYEPDAAILKAGAFKCFGARFGLAKLHPNTHLYTSALPVAEIPGRTFEVETVVKYSRKAVEAVLPGRKAHVAVRNFPDSVDLVRKKTGLADGGEHYVFGTRTIGDQICLIVCRRLTAPTPG